MNHFSCKTVLHENWFDLGLCRYAYSEETGEDFEEEAISLTGGGIMAAGDLATKLERKERKVSIAADHHHVFGLGEDLEEDKRE